MGDTITTTTTILQATEPETWDRVNISMLNASIVAVLGFVMVFVGLIALMAVIVMIGKIFIAKDKKAAAAAAAVPAPVVEEAPLPMAPGAAGSLKLYNVEPKTAAMLMAIVADKMGKPLNELRFLSIKEVE